MRVCILGATGLVGRETIRLAQQAWPTAELVGFASRARTLQLGATTLAIRAAEDLERAGAPAGELAFVALDDAHSARYVPRLLELGYRVVDKSNTYRMDPKVPLVAASVNCGAVDDGQRLIANPNCTTIPLTMALAPMARAHGLRGVAVSSYQAISGAGLSALEAFLAAAKSGYASVDTLGTQLDPQAYVGNTVPHNGKTDESGFSAEERKLMHESRKILAVTELETSAQCCRVPVAVGHYMNAWATFAEPVTPQSLLATLRDHTTFLRVFDSPDAEGLTALACAHDRDRALVGRIRLDPRDTNGCTACLTIAGDNLRLGAATNAVRVASRWYPSREPSLQAPGLMP